MLAARTKANASRPKVHDAFSGWVGWCNCRQAWPLDCQKSTRLAALKTGVLLKDLDGQLPDATAHQWLYAMGMVFMIVARCMFHVPGTMCRMMTLSFATRVVNTMEGSPMNECLSTRS